MTELFLDLDVEGCNIGFQSEKKIEATALVGIDDNDPPQERVSLASSKELCFDLEVSVPSGS